MSFHEDIGVQVQTVGHELQNPPAQLGTAQEERSMAVMEIRQKPRGQLLQGGTEPEPEPEPHRD